MLTRLYSVHSDARTIEEKVMDTSEKVKALAREREGERYTRTSVSSVASLAPGNFYKVAID